VKVYEFHAYIPWQMSTRYVWLRCRLTDTIVTATHGSNLINSTVLDAPISKGGEFNLPKGEE